jgi:hypothetical protein
LETDQGNIRVQFGHHSSHGRWLIPKRGTLLDRFVPVLVLGAILFVAARQIKSPDLWTPTPAANADNGSADNGGYLNNSDSDSGDTP